MKLIITKAENGVIVRTTDGKVFVFTDLNLFWAYLKEVWKA
jgi:hypothetical protein